MDQPEAKVANDRLALATSGFLALTLGLGMASPAHAGLIITSFSPSDTTTLNNNDPVNFGPSWDTGGFTAQLSEDPGGDVFFGLTGNAGNTVAIDNTAPTFGCIGIGIGSNCLQLFAPGDVIDGNLTFASSGNFKVTSGDYYFGLSDAVSPTTDPYGWVQISVDDTQVTLDRYAFMDNTDPAPIPAPEPSDLPLFALGAAAVLAARALQLKARG